ncbi:MAG TPA: archaeosine synthase subunit alpha [Methanospirillum sp.]|nr:archaeosine synthase subunit alpha [Methanospirillum sp.]
MRTCEFTTRDGTARVGRLRLDNAEYSLPGAYDTSAIFPALTSRKGVTFFPTDRQEFVSRFFKPDGEQPKPIHIQVDESFVSGDVLLASNWHTIFGQTREFVRQLEELKKRVVPDTCWYYPGNALPENVAVLVHAGFDLFDYTGVDLKSAQYRFCLADGDHPVTVMEDGLCNCPGCQAGDLKAHNRYALNQELAVIRTRIKNNTFRDLLDGRCRVRPEYVSIVRLIDRTGYMEQHTPVTRPTTLFATSGDSLHRPEVKRFAERLLNRYIPPLADVAVLLPCSARKPYSLSQTHKKFMQAIGRRAHELILTSPLGLVPRELEMVYPAAQYDVPVTGYWDHEERFQIGDILTKYFQKHQYRRVIAHLDGDALIIAKQATEAAGIALESTCDTRPTDPSALRALNDALAGERKIKSAIIRGMASVQFGYDLRVPGLEMKGSYPEVVVKQGRRQIFSLEPTTGLFRPTFEGWQMIETGYRVYIDNFVPQGDILAPGVVQADPRIREGDEVLVIGDKAMATGRAAMGADEMIRSTRGVAVRVRKVKKLDDQ